MEQIIRRVVFDQQPACTLDDLIRTGARCRVVVTARPGNGLTRELRRLAAAHPGFAVLPPNWHGDTGTLAGLPSAVDDRYRYALNRFRAAASPAGMILRDALDNTVQPARDALVAALQEWAAEYPGPIVVGLTTGTIETVRLPLVFAVGALVPLTAEELRTILIAPHPETEA